MVCQKKYEEKPSCIRPLGIRILPHLKEAGIENISIICDFSKFPDSPPWTFATPEVLFDLCRLRKSCTSSLAYKALFSELCTRYPSFQTVFTDGSKSDEGVASAAYLSRTQSCTSHIHSDSSVYTSELNALLLALGMLRSSQHREFLICTDSLSALQAI